MTGRLMDADVSETKVPIHEPCVQIRNAERAMTRERPKVDLGPWSKAQFVVFEPSADD